MNRKTRSSSLLASLMLASGIGLCAAPSAVAGPPPPGDVPPAAAPGAPGAAAPAAEPNPFANVKFDEGPTTGKLEEYATIDIPEGFLFASGRRESGKFMEATKNTPSGQEVGVLLPANGTDDWWVVFMFDPVGYVKDDEKDNLDADKLLDALKEGTEEGNKERKRRGWDDLHVTGWHKPPRYNPATHNLEWSIRLKGATGEDINHQVRLLGRRGVMSATLVVSPEAVEASLPRFQKVLEGYKYVQTESYAAWRPGDKVAEYGLIALVTGGTLAVAAKSGLLGKLIKPLILGLAAIGAAIKRLFTGKKKDA